MDLNKKKIHYYSELNKDFELLSTKVIQQLYLVEQIFKDGWNTHFHEEASKNEEIIKGLERSFMEKNPILLLLYSPKAKELRKIISCNNVILFLEEISDNLMSIIKYLEQINLNSPDFNDFKTITTTMFHVLREIISATTYSFYKDDKNQALNILEKENEIQILAQELKDNLIASFQDIPLTGQELLNIVSLHKIGAIMKKTTNYALNIAKATIFVIDGINIKHQN